MKKYIFTITLCLLASSAFAMKKITGDVVSSVMNHDLKDVISRHKKDLGINDSEAQLHERELKRYLAMCIIHPQAKLGMFSPQVDNVWHNFILFTKEYAQFCYKNTGGFLHHAPTIGKQDQAEVRSNLRDFTAKYKTLFNENPPANVWPQANASKEYEYSGTCSVEVALDCLPEKYCIPMLCVDMSQPSATDGAGASSVNVPLTCLPYNCIPMMCDLNHSDATNKKIQSIQIKKHNA
jgi:hypothetical protein